MDKQPYSLKREEKSCGSKLLWFVGLYLVSIIGIGMVAFLLKLIIRII